MSRGRFGVVVMMFLTVGGCGTTEMMPIPTVGAANVAGIDIPVEKQASFALSRVVADIKRGTAIAHFPSAGVPGVDSQLCNHRYGSGATLEWVSGSSELGNWSNELGEIFYEALSNKGLNVAGDPKSLFKRRDSVSAAEYLIGARITEIRGNFCRSHHWWDGRPLRQFSGEMYVSVQWTIFSRLTQREVLKFNTEGYHKQKTSNRSGIIATFHNAFADASENVLQIDDFKQLSSGKYSKVKNREDFAELRIPKISLLANPIDETVDNIIPSVVTLRAGGGHGSGFIIAENGMILTNQHVVGESKRVSVILSNGLELEGAVLRTNAERDVALVKVPLRVPHALALRSEPARRLEKVYVVGTPLSEGLRSTVTTGIVSAIRTDRGSKLKFIQSDAAVSGGNSGGPLLDAKGNVIGISVLKLITETTESLNLFIPIADALNALNIKEVVPKG